jgi:hypothetical protein
VLLILVDRVVCPQRLDRSAFGVVDVPRFRRADTAQQLVDFPGQRLRHGLGDAALAFAPCGLPRRWRPAVADLDEEVVKMGERLLDADELGSEHVAGAAGTHSERTAGSDIRTSGRATSTRSTPWL